MSAILEVNTEFLINKEILTQDEVNRYLDLKIVTHDPEAWLFLHNVQIKVSKALKEGIVEKLPSDLIEIKAGFQIITDGLGTHGVRNQVDGQTYDSKSQLRKSYKAHGVEEVGNEPLPSKPREQRGDYDCKADVAQAMKQLGVY